MDAPAKLPDNIAAEEGGQQQMHQDDKEHRPMFRRVKDKMRKMKNTIAGHGHGHDHDHDHEQDTGGGDSNSTGEDEQDAATREAEVEKGGYQQDVEDKPIFADSSPEQHGAPSKVKHNDAPGVRLGDLGAPAAAQEVKRDDAPGVRLGDLGAPAAAQEVKRDDPAGMRLGDLGGPASAKEVRLDDTQGVPLGDFGGPASAKEVKLDDTQGVPLGDFGGPASAKEVKLDDTQGVPLGDLGSPVVEDPAVPMPRGGQDIGTTDAVRNFEAMTVPDDPKQVGVSKEYEAMPVSDGTGEEWNDAPTDAEYTGSDTDRLKNTAAGTVYEKVAGVSTAVASKVTPGLGAGGKAQDDSSATAAPESVTAGAGKRDLDLPQEGTRASYTSTEGLKNAPTGATDTEGLQNAATDATGTEGAPGATYTDMIKSAAAGTTEYGKKLASTVYDMIKSAVAGATEYGRKLASTVYEKVAGVGTAVASKAQQVTTSAGTAVLHGAAPRTNTNVM